MTARPDIAERNRAIVEMAKAGTPPGVIARRFGIAPAAAGIILGNARKAGEDVPRFSSSGRMIGAKAEPRPPTPLDLRIIALAIAGKPPRVIRQEIPEATQGIVANALTAARRAGIAIPDFRPPARPEGPTKAALAERERSKKPAAIRRAEAPSAPLPVSPNEMTADDDQRLTAYWTRGNCNITHLAALMRKKYAVIHEAVERLNLSRAPGIVVERRVET